MKLALTVLFASLALTGGTQLASAESGSSKWVCKTAPIWNGKTHYPRLESGTTNDEAYNRAVGACRYSGYADYCVSQISCWQE